MTELVRYEAARRALAEAVRVDEVKQIRDLAVAAQLYARQANNPELINNATDIRKRAERRTGEILIEMKDRGERHDGRGHVSIVGSRVATPRAEPKLADLKITKTQSSRWQSLATLSNDQFERHVETAKKKAVDSLRAATDADFKKQQRAAKETALAERTIAASRALNRRRYGVIYADPPWRFEPYSRDTGMDRAADNHYPTMTLDAIKALQIPAADDCILFLWATIPMLPQALSVIDAWGFSYKSHCVWVKDKIGHGFWFRAQHELLLIATRGSVPAPAPGDQYPSIITAPRQLHSAKPACFYEMIEEMFPTLPRLEMFARNETGSSFACPAGWDQWGNEAVQSDAADD